MAYELSLYRPRFPTAGYSTTHNGERYYQHSVDTSRYADFWVCPVTRQQIADGAPPVVMGTKVVCLAGTTLSISSYSSSSYQSAHSIHSWTHHLGLNINSFGISTGEEFDLEISVDAEQVQVIVNGYLVATVSTPSDSHVRIARLPNTPYVHNILFRSSYETRDLEARLGSWEFQELTPVLLPGQPLSLGQLLGNAVIAETTAVNFRLNPEELSDSGRVVAMQLRHDYSHRRQSPRGGEAQFYYEGVDTRTLNMGLTGANSTSFSTDRADLQTDLSKTDFGSVVHQIRYTLTPNAFDPLA